VNRRRIKGIYVEGEGFEGVEGGAGKGVCHGSACMRERHLLSRRRKRLE